MKIIKLNRRFRQFKEANHQIGFRFDSYNADCTAIESALRDITQAGGWERWGDWYSYFGTARDTFGMRPYFITVRTEEIATMALLKAGI